MSAGRHIKSELSRPALGRMGFMYLVRFLFSSAERQPPARIIQQLIGMSQPNMVTRVSIRDNKFTFRVPACGLLELLVY